MTAPSPKSFASLTFKTDGFSGNFFQFEPSRFLSLRPVPSLTVRQSSFFCLVSPPFRAANYSLKTINVKVHFLGEEICATTLLGLTKR